jgi:hypothetical protein
MEQSQVYTLPAAQTAPLSQQFHRAVRDQEATQSAGPVLPYDILIHKYFPAG